jgi:hypothetical protein
LQGQTGAAGGIEAGDLQLSATEDRIVSIMGDTVISGKSLKERYSNFIILSDSSFKYNLFYLVQTKCFPLLLQVYQVVLTPWNHTLSTV